MYPESSLITTKFNIPTANAKLLKRMKLFKKLDAFSEYKLILITAPAGYGKTTLVASWLTEKLKSNLVISWVSLDEYDNDPEYFWSYFFLSVYKKVSEIHGNDGINRSNISLYDSSAPFNKLYLSHFINQISVLKSEVLVDIK